MMRTASGTKKNLKNYCGWAKHSGKSFGVCKGFRGKWRRTRAVKLHKARHPAMAVHYRIKVHWMKPARRSILDAILVPVVERYRGNRDRAAATAYSDSSSPVSSLKNFLNMIILLDLESLVPADAASTELLPLPALARSRSISSDRVRERLILVPMLPPNSVKAATQANATSAAATAYSESSRPVSSRKIS